eukprot:6193668-Pleurochrysis_carterae.AAC.1
MPCLPRELWHERSVTFLARKVLSFFGAKTPPLSWRKPWSRFWRGNCVAAGCGVGPGGAARGGAAGDIAALHCQGPGGRTRAHTPVGIWERAVA